MKIGQKSGNSISDFFHLGGTGRSRFLNIKIINFKSKCRTVFLIHAGKPYSISIFSNSEK